MSIFIPEDILKAAEITEDELKLELALLLYQKNKVSSGKIRSWLGLSVLEFQHELAKRNLCINYDIEELNQDIENLQFLGLL
jgi:predicted HTH domain antitoxin